jgi:hypothetical protein
VRAEFAVIGVVGPRPAHRHQRRVRP